MPEPPLSEPELDARIKACEEVIAADESGDGMRLAKAWDDHGALYTVDEQLAVLRELRQLRRERDEYVRGHLEAKVLRGKLVDMKDEAQKWHKEAQSAESRVEALEGALRVLGDGPSAMLKYCHAHGIDTTGTYTGDEWRKLIARAALAPAGGAS